jgi:D-3-phosphoglycerate dehydrogenase
MQQYSYYFPHHRIPGEDMSKYTVAILEDRYKTHKFELEILNATDAEAVEYSRPMDEDGVLKACREVDGVLVNLAPMTSKVIKGMHRCRVISRYGIGVDNVDIQTATQMGIVVTNVPGFCAEEVSDQALALLLACARKITMRDRLVREGKWNIGSDDPIYRIRGKVLGLIGYGKIPQVLHRKIKGFEFRSVLVYDPYLPAEVIKKSGGVPVKLERLLRESDFISLHAPLTDDTHHMIGANQLKLMKKTAIFINTSRGGLVDTRALYETLRNRKINSAGLDVHEIEPVPADYPLFELENVALSDHTGWYSEESQRELQIKAASNVVNVLIGKPPLNVVNKEVLSK